MKTVSKIISLIILTLIFCWGCTSHTEVTITESESADSTVPAKNQYKDIVIDLSEIRDIYPLLCQAWEMEDDLESLDYSDAATGNLVSRSFHLFSDNSFVANPRNELEYGQWQYDDQKKMIHLQFISGNGRKEDYKIGALSAHELKIVKMGESKSPVLKFVSDGLAYKNSREDPFYLLNNHWRQKPAHAETNSEIRVRMKSCVNFYRLFYRDQLIRDEKKVSFYGFPTCFKWYAGGIYLVKKDALENNWYACFYNKKQAMDGYAIVENLIGKPYEWPKGEKNWVKSNFSVLQQMYDLM